MGAYVSVESFEALKRLRAALCRFAEVVSAGLGESDAELQRAQHWVQPEQSNYWKREGVKRRELLGRAKSALAFKKMQTTSSGSRPSCVEEENALALAKRRLEEAEQKLANVRSWSHRLGDEVHSYQAVTGGLNLALTVDLPNAITQLDNMLAALEAYAPSTAPQVQGSSADVGAEAVPDAKAELGSMARAAPPQPPEDGSVVLDGVVPEAVLDAEDKRLWPTVEKGPS